MSGSPRPPASAWTGTPELSAAHSPNPSLNPCHAALPAIQTGAVGTSPLPSSCSALGSEQVPGGPVPNTVRAAVRIRPLTLYDQISIPAPLKRTAVVPDGPTGVRVEAALPSTPDESSSSSSSSKDPCVEDKASAYVYDFVLSSEQSQADVYAQSVRSLVSRFLAGENATILAYGQSGSGKSYTLGTASTALPTPGAAYPEDTGIIPRSIQEILEGIQQLNRHRADSRFSLGVTFQQLHHGNLIDLLLDQDRPVDEQPPTPVGQDGTERAARSRMSYIPLTPKEGVDEALRLLAKGNALRHTLQTETGAHISDTHAFVCLTLTQTHPRSSSSGDVGGPLFTSHSLSENQVVTESKFQFVDLARSDWPQGERAEEEAQTKLELDSLGNVISALAHVANQKLDRGRSLKEVVPHVHVPFADSRLTHILQDSLDGNAHVLMICCVSPAHYNLPETTRTLQYASRAVSLLGNSQDIVHSDEEPGWEDLSRLQALVTQLRDDLSEARAAEASLQNLADAHDREEVATQPVTRGAQCANDVTIQNEKPTSLGPSENGQDIVHDQLVEKQTEIRNSIQTLEARIAQWDTHLATARTSLEQWNSLDDAQAEPDGTDAATMKGTHHGRVGGLSEAEERQERIKALGIQVTGNGNDDLTSTRAELALLKLKYANAMHELSSSQLAHQEALQRAETLQAKMSAFLPSAQTAPRSRTKSGTDDQIEVLSSHNAPHSNQKDDPVRAARLTRRSSTGTRQKLMNRADLGSHESLRSLILPDGEIGRSKEGNESEGEGDRIGRGSKRAFPGPSRPSSSLLSRRGGELPSPLATRPSSSQGTHRRSSSAIVYRPPDSPAAPRDLNDVVPLARQHPPGSRQSSQDDHSTTSATVPGSDHYQSGADHHGAQPRHGRTFSSTSSQTGRRPLSLVECNAQMSAPGCAEPLSLSSPSHSAAPALMAEEAQRKIRSLERERDTLQALLIQREDELDGLQRSDLVSAVLGCASAPAGRDNPISPLKRMTSPSGDDSATGFAFACASCSSRADSVPSASNLVPSPPLRSTSGSYDSTGSSPRGSAQVHELLAQLAARENDHKDSLAAQRADHERHLSELESSHAKALADLNTRQSEALASLRAEMEKEIGSLRTACDEARSAHAQEQARGAQLSEQIQVDPVEVDMLRAELTDTSDALVVLEGALTEAQTERDRLANELAVLGETTGKPGLDRFKGTARSGGSLIMADAGSAKLQQELEAQRSLSTRAEAELAQAKTELQVSQAECARNEAVLRDTKQQLVQVERALASRASLVYAKAQSTGLLDEVAGQGDSCPPHTADRNSTSSKGDKVASNSPAHSPRFPPVGPPPSDPPPPTPTTPSSVQPMTGLLKSPTQPLSSTHFEAPMTAGIAYSPDSAVAEAKVPAEETQRLQNEMERLRLKLAQMEAESHASSELMATLEAALNDSERNLRKARTQLSEAVRERDVFSAQSGELQAQVDTATAELAATQSRVEEQRQALEREIEQERAARHAARQDLSNRLEEVTKRKSSRLFCM